KWYIEKWQTKVGDIYYKAYTLTSIPKSMIDEAYGEAIDTEKEKLKEKIKEAKNFQAKKQMEDALNAFDKMKESGFGNN
ncbi:MAG TPA: hypothetical protein PKY81_17225, partial [bacterium]|nr:hypothetical protein [bacterium]